MRLNRAAALVVFGVLVASLVGGCATTNKVLKASPAPDSGFLENAEEMKENRERAPFNRVWVDPAFSASNYQSILVAPVNTDYALKESTWAKTNVRRLVTKDIKQDFAMISGEFHGIVVQRFTDSKQNRFAIVDAPTDDTMILELAITQLVPGKAFLGTIGLASWAAPAPVGVPVGMAAAYAQSGWMAIEGRVRDMKTGKVMAMFADREQSKTRVIDLEALTWYGNARESMSDWADQLVLLANTPKDVKVDDSSAFTLKPW
jgi:uncharacterized protein DUF3313